MAVGPSHARSSGCEDTCGNAHRAQPTVGSAAQGPHFRYQPPIEGTPARPLHLCKALTLQPVSCKWSVLLSEQSLKSAG